MLGIVRAVDDDDGRSFRYVFGEPGKLCAKRVSDSQTKNEQQRPPRLALGIAMQTLKHGDDIYVLPEWIPKGVNQSQRGKN